jgi:hypothetical protein
MENKIILNQVYPDAGSVSRARLRVIASPQFPFIYHFTAWQFAFCTHPWGFAQARVARPSADNAPPPDWLFLLRVDESYPVAWSMPLMHK